MLMDRRTDHGRQSHWCTISSSMRLRLRYAKNLGFSPQSEMGEKNTVGEIKVWSYGIFH